MECRICGKTRTCTDCLLRWMRQSRDKLSALPTEGKNVSETKFDVAKLRAKAERRRDEAQAKLDARNTKIVEVTQEFAAELADPESDLTSARNITDQFAARLLAARGNDEPRSEFITQIKTYDKALAWLDMVADESVVLYDAPHQVKTLVEDL